MSINKRLGNMNHSYGTPKLERVLNANPLLVLSGL